MKIALITDQHFGVRNNSIQFLDYFEKFYQTVFFPYLDNNNIKTIINLGDTFDRRKEVNFLTLSRTNKMWFDEIEKRKIHQYVIIGNHDTYFKNTNKQNSIRSLYGSRQYTFTWYETPAEIAIDGCQILLMPWICQETYQNSIKMIGESKSSILMGHLELAGFEMQRGSINQHGQDKNLFKGFDLVYSGHFHHRSSAANITYLGAPCEYIWSDYSDPRGFHIFDTDTRELDFIQNPISMFKRIEYSDTGKTIDEICGDVEFGQYENTMVRLVVSNRSDSRAYDIFLKRLQESKPIDIQVIEDPLNLKFVETQSSDIQVRDTPSLLTRYIQDLPDMIVNRERLISETLDLYREAQLVE